MYYAVFLLCVSPVIGISALAAWKLRGRLLEEAFRMFVVYASMVGGVLACSTQVSNEGLLFILNGMVIFATFFYCVAVCTSVFDPRRR